MSTAPALPPDYLALAAKRVAAQCSPHKQPEDFGYNFRRWVSPYTKGAHRLGGIAVVLQDWASADSLAGPLNPAIQLQGRTPTLLTNVRLEHLLEQVFGLRLAEVYATNAFPFVKAGGISAHLRMGEVRDAASEFAIRELELAKPTVVLALGAVAHAVLRGFDVDCVRLPHPAARIGGASRHEAAWREALKAAGVPVRRPTE
jgi:hypothetical protein